MLLVKRSFKLLLVILCSTPAWAEPVKDRTYKQLQICDLRDHERSPVVDGLLDEAIWKERAPRSDLQQQSPIELGAPTEKTEFWVCYDHEYLYVAVMAYMQDASKLVARQHVQGLPFESDDQIHISIDPFLQRRDGYFFQVNPNGMRNDALIWEGPTGFNGDWDSIWFAASKRLPNGWSTEMKIPFRTMGFNPANANWGFNLGRAIRSKNELLAWNVPGAGIWEMGAVAMGSINGISEVSTGRGLDVQLSAKQAFERKASMNDIESRTEPSLDLLYRPLPRVTVTASINTDFSATDVDDRVINLDRFDLYLPEKRKFFLQDSSRFAFGEIMDNGSPFFSRRIGLAENGQPLDMHWGLKAAGSLNNTNFGVLAVNQDVLGLGEDTKNLIAMRVAQNLSQQFTLGGIYTKGNPDIDAETSTAGVDMSYSNLGQESQLPFRSSFWYQQTHLEQAGFRPQEDRDQAAWGAGVTLPGSRYEFIWNLVNVGKDFDPGLGFVNRRDIRRHYGEGRYRYYFESGPVQSFSPEFYTTYVTNTENELQSTFLQLTPLKFTSSWGDVVGIGRVFQSEHLDSGFSPVKNLAIPPGEYEFSSNAISVKTSEARRIFLELDLKQGDFYSGWSRQQKVKLGLRPWDRLLFQFTYGENDMDINNQFVTTRLLAYKHEIAFTDNWAWLTNIQYDNQSRKARFNYRVRWMPEPHMEFYALYNRGAQKTDWDDRLHTEEETAALKFSYTFGL